jgi:protein TonB
MSKEISTITLSALLVLAINVVSSAQSNLTAKASGFQPQPVATAVESDRVKDGLVGPVRRVRTEVVKLSNEDGKAVEGKHTLLEVVAYDIKGNKIENQYFPIAGATLTGKEVYKYDDRGNISEMTLFNSDGSLLSKEVYKYEFDFAGNWNKMTTSVAVIDGGKLSFELTEVTYRSIMYYLDENIVKLAQPGGLPMTSSAAAPNTSSNVANTNPEPKNQPSVTAAADNKQTTSQKSSAPLPTSTLTVEGLAGSSATDLKNVSPNANSKAPAIFLDSEPPPSPGPKPILKPVSGGVLNGTALNLPAPTYPDLARRMRVSGTVSVDVVVDETGKIISAQANSGPLSLRDAAVQAALRARFSPTKLSGQPVKVSGIINYKFALQQ